MLRVFTASGQQALAIEFQDLVEMACVNEEPEQHVRVLALKRHLQRLCGQTRFKQRLLVDGRILSDDALLEGPLEAQLIVLPFEASSQDKISQLAHAARDNHLQEMEQLLQRPQDPNLHPSKRLPALHCACGRGNIGAVRPSAAGGQC